MKTPIQTRKFDPPRSELGSLVNPLTNGEQQVIDLLAKHLPIEWEFYVKPHLNGLRPDLVLLNPAVGIAVFEIEDWDFNSFQYSAVTDVSTGELRLIARSHTGHVSSRESDNPINRIRLYKDEIFNLYCPRLKDRLGFAAITGGIIFTQASWAQIEPIISSFRMLESSASRYPQYWPIAAKEHVLAEKIDVIFPEWNRKSSNVMSDLIAEDLRGWLKEPALSSEQRQPLEMDVRQRELATTRTESGYRRIKGPAGSGKSVVLAARAAELANQNKSVLVVTYNITLLNYLRDLTARHAPNRKILRREIDFLNFHMWCKRVCLSSGQQLAYNKVWKSSVAGDELQPDPVLQVGLAGLVQNLYKDPIISQSLPHYDALFVDEGQDCNPLWWQTLRNAVTDGGELILIADKTQNIYSTAAGWTEDVMANAGFRGPWTELKISYRLPPAIFPLLELFVKNFLKSEEVDIPEIEKRDNQMEFSDLFPVELRWVQLGSTNSIVSKCVEEIKRQMKLLQQDTAIPDIIFLSGKTIGRFVVNEFELLNVRIIHTFDEDKFISSRQKRAFFQGSATIKATTLHSFKGWEARHLVLHVSDIKRAEDRALIYTALTRLQRHIKGSLLTVVCSCPELAEYGKAWPEFVSA